MKAFRLKEFVLESGLEQLCSNTNSNSYNAIIYLDNSFTNLLQHSKYISKYEGYLVELHEGDVIGTLSISKKLISASKCYQITDTRDYQKLQVQLVVPQDAYYIFPKSDSPIFNQSFPYDDIVLCNSFESNQEMTMHFQKEKERHQKEVEHFLENECSYTISDDAFTGEKRILWKNWYKLRFGGGGTFPYIILQNSKEQFIIKYHKKDFSEHKFQIGDRIHFLFEDKTCLHVQLKGMASNTDTLNYKQISFSLFPQDIVLFSTKSLIRVRFEFPNGDENLDLRPENEIATLSFKIYFQKYIEALSECGIDINSKVINRYDSIERKEETFACRKVSSCYVYLMKDVSNGYYKIGMSNKPEYRERTLQSEKPTLILISAKEYPSRIIAEAIESSLHKAFGEKRLRGEWFELDKDDVEDIKSTLL